MSEALCSRNYALYNTHWWPFYSDDREPLRREIRLRLNGIGFPIICEIQIYCVRYNTRSESGPNQQGLDIRKGECHTNFVNERISLGEIGMMSSWWGFSPSNSGIWFRLGGHKLILPLLEGTIPRGLRSFGAVGSLSTSSHYYNSI